MKKYDVKSLAKRGGDSTMLIVLMVILVIFFSVLNPSFLSANSFSSIMKQIPEIGLFTMAMMLPMLVGGVDLSIIASANLASILMSMYMNAHAEKGETGIAHVLVAMLICMLVCMLVGLINGVIVAKFQIPAMLVTLGMQMVLTGIALGITKGGTLSGYPDSFKFIGNGYYLMRAILIAVLGGVDPNGGKGKVSGILWAVLLFQCMATGLNILRVNSYIVIALYGAILLFSVAVRTRKECA